MINDCPDTCIVEIVLTRAYNISGIQKTTAVLEAIVIIINNSIETSPAWPGPSLSTHASIKPAVQSPVPVKWPCKIKNI